MIFPSQGPSAGWNGIRMCGTGCIVYGRRNARPGTTIADHWLHCSLLLYSKDHLTLSLLVLPCPAGHLRPTLPPFALHQVLPFYSDLLLYTFWLTDSFHARSGSLTACSFLLRRSLCEAKINTPEQAFPPLYTLHVRQQEVRVLWDKVERKYETCSDLIPLKWSLDMLPFLLAKYDYLYSVYESYAAQIGENI